jgi:hypothetical protein
MFMHNAPIQGVIIIPDARGRDLHPRSSCPAHKNRAYANFVECFNSPTHKRTTQISSSYACRRGTTKNPPCGLV